MTLALCISIGNDVEMGWRRDLVCSRKIGQRVEEESTLSAEIHQARLSTSTYVCCLSRRCKGAYLRVTFRHYATTLNTRSRLFSLWLQD
jgi:hypothetical protein